jgi:hypothetical protein
MLGHITFLSDKSFEPSMAMAIVCAGFGVGENTAKKAQIIARALDAHRSNPGWSLDRILERNPLVWMVEVNGLLVDLRDMPRELQEISFEKGMISYIRADQERRYPITYYQKHLC